MTTGNGLKMKIDLARYGRAPQPFTPAPLRPPVDHDLIVEGYASPSTIDREFTKFASHCWLGQRRRNIPLLFRHQRDRVVGEIIDIAAHYEKGLFVRARITDAEAKRCSYFSVAATVLDYELRSPDDPKAAHALITKANLDEVSITPEPANADAIFRPTPAAIAFYVTAQRGVSKLIQMVEVLQKMDREHNAKQAHARLTSYNMNSAPARAPRPRTFMTGGPPRRPTQFRQLVNQMEERSQL